MDYIDLQRAFGYLEIRPPYGLLPGNHNEAAGPLVNPAETEQAWNAYIWGGPDDETGPQYDRDIPEFSDPDLSASPKPTYAGLQSGARLAIIEFHAEQALSGIHDEETRRICAAYLADQDVPQTVEQELLYRQRAAEKGTDISTKHTERDRLRDKAVALRVWVEHADRTLAELEAFDPTADLHWSAPSD